MSDAGDDERKQAQCMSACEEYRRKAFSNPTVRFLTEALKRANCEVTPDFVKCAMCDNAIQGVSGLNVNEAGEQQIILCANRKLPREETAVENIVHEMIHAFDNCRAKVDWSNPVHRACSEIRAANLSGDCHWIREYERYRYRKEWMMPMLKQQQACVRRRAILSVKEMPGMTEEAAAAAVDTAWQTCYQDHAPFERPP